MRIVVIGAGFAGLAAGIRLQAQGHHVTIVDRLDSPGGRARVFRQDGFTFDAGPTIVTAPWLLEDLFSIAGKRLADVAPLVKLSPFYNVRFEDGSVFAYSGVHEDILQQIAAFNPTDIAGYEAFAKKTADVFRAGFALIDKPFLKVSDMLRVAPDLIRLQSYKSVATFVNQYIRDPRLQQVFSFHPLLVGGNPFQTTSIYALIHHLEKEWGVWFAMGGTGKLVSALADAFSSMGGVLHLGDGAAAIDVSPTTRRATAVRLDSGRMLPSDVVVSNADIAQTYMRLIPTWARPKNSDARQTSRRYSMSLFVIYFGTNRKYNDIAHHEILMGPRYRELLADIFDKKVLADDFSLYLHRPTATDPSLAPPGCDCWYALSPVPHLGSGIDWERRSQQYRNAIVAYLEKRYLPNLSDHIVSERRVDPRYFRDDLDSYLGSAFSVEPTLLQSAWFRPHNRSEDIANLYFCGAGTHPGAGIPGVLSSAKIVADLVADDGA